MEIYIVLSTIAYIGLIGVVYAFIQRANKRKWGENPDGIRHIFKRRKDETN